MHVTGCLRNHSLFEKCKRPILSMVSTLGGGANLLYSHLVLKEICLSVVELQSIEYRRPRR